MTNEQMLREFEAWKNSQDQAEPEPERTYELSEDGMNELIDSVMFQAWQATTIKANQWRPIADAPKDQTAILVIGTLHSMLQPCPIVVVAYFDRGWWAQSGGVVTYVTHWQPLPLPPTGTEQDKL